MSPKQWSEYMAKQVCQQVQSGIPTSESMLAELFQNWINSLLADENKQLLDELTNLAYKEDDSSRRAGYFRLARLVQTRIPKDTEATA